MAVAVKDVSGRFDRTAYAPLDAAVSARLHAAYSDLAEGVARHRAWRYLAAEHVKNSYRRTVLGPWWLTAQQAVYVAGLAFVFSQLFHQNLRSFLPFVAVGFVAYVLLVGLVRTGANAFVGSAGIIKSTRQPLSSLVLRNVTVEVIQFAHNSVISLVFFAIGYVRPHVWLVLFPFALFVIVINGLFLGLWLGPVVARFRDVGPAIESILQVAIFFAPIFYKTSDLSGLRGTLIRWNPFTPFIDLLRDTVFGVRPAFATWAGVGLFTLVDFVLAVVVFSRSRSRIPYWVA